MVAGEDGNVQGDLDRIVEAVVYLCTESRRAPKELGRERGLIGPQARVLAALEDKGAPRISELGSRASAKSSTITGMGDRTERDGLMLRRRTARDRRTVHLDATPLGRDIAATVRVAAMEIFGSAIRSLSVEDRVEPTRALGILAERVRGEVATRDNLGA